MNGKIKTRLNINKLWSINEEVDDDDDQGARSPMHRLH